MPACPLCNTPDCTRFAEVEGRRYHRCPDCALTFLDSRQLPGSDDERAIYDLHENAPDDPAYRAFLSRLTVHLLPRLRPGARGLDYGCGPGPALARLCEEQGFSMRIYDPFFSPGTAALDECYDFVTCTEAVEHFHRPGIEFARLAALLKPGGYLGIMTSWLADDAKFHRWHYRRDPTHVCFYKPETFAAIAERHGWSVEFPAMNIALMRKDSGREIHMGGASSRRQTMKSGRERPSRKDGEPRPEDFVGGPSPARSAPVKPDQSVQRGGKVLRHVFP